MKRALKAWLRRWLEIPEPQAAPAPELAVTQEVLARAKRRPVATDSAWAAYPNGARPVPGKFNIEPMKPAPGVVPGDDPHIAMDQQQVVAIASWAQQAYNSAFAEGVTWLGYAYLSELAQRPEYRRITEVIATEMTRKGFKLKAAGNEDKTQRVKELGDELKRLDVVGVLRKAAAHDGYFGRGHIFVDLGTEDREELKKSIGDGWNFTSETKVTKGTLKRLANVEPVWVYPTSYDSVDPLKEDWYDPTTWYVMGTEISSTRLIRIVGREVPDILKPAYMFGGLSMSQMAKPYVDNWLRTRQSVSDIISAFSVFVIKTNLAAALQLGGEALFRRAELFNVLRDNRGLMMIDKDAEDFDNVSTSLASLDVLQAQSQEHMAAVSGIPIVKLLGIHPAGLNASEDGDLRSFYDWIHAYQENIFSKPLRTLIGFAMLNIWGELDPDIEAEWEDLWGMDKKEKADVKKVEAETGGALIQNGVIDPAEERRRIAADEDGPYAALDLDPDALPEPPQMPGMEGGEEMPGLVPEMPGGGPREERLEGRGVEKDPREERTDRGRDAMFPDRSDRSEGREDRRGDDREDRRQARDQALRLAGLDVVDGVSHLGDDIWIALDAAEFKESDHPRDEDGKFSTSAGGKAKPKKQIIKELLEKGTTAAELVKATGWPSVSVPWQAKQLGIGFVKYKEDGVTKYKAVPLEKGKEKPAPKPDTAAEEKKAKEAAAKKFADQAHGEAVKSSIGFYGKILGHSGDQIAIEWEEEAGAGVTYSPIAQAAQMLAAAKQSPKPAAAKQKFGEEAETFAGGHVGEMVEGEYGAKGEVSGTIKHGQVGVKWWSGGTTYHSIEDVEKMLKAGSGKLPEPIQKFTPKYAEALKKITTAPDTLETAKEKIKLAVQSDASAEAATAALTDKEKSLIDKQYGSVEAAYKKGQGYHAQKMAQQKSAAEQQKTAAEQAEKNKQAAAAHAEAMKKAKAEAAETNKAAMKDLGITHQEAEGFGALVSMMGSSYADVVKDFKHYESSYGHLGYPLTGFEIALIKSYTDGAYGAVNKALRAGSVSLSQHIYTKLVNKALRKMPAHKGTVRRGTGLTKEQQALYVAGNVVEERAFTSTSTGSGWSGNTKFTIDAKGKRGHDVKKLSNHKSENEVLFEARTLFKVTKVEGHPGGDMHVHMEELEME